MPQHPPEDGDEDELAKPDDLFAEVEDRIISLFEEAVDVLWDALDEREGLSPHDFVDEQCWRGRLEQSFNALVEEAYCEFDMLKSLGEVPQKMAELQNLMAEEAKAPELASGVRSMRRILKARTQSMARAFFHEKPYPTIKAILESPAFIKGVTDGNSEAIPVPAKTLRSWISKIAPMEVRRGGRPPKAA